MNTVRTRFAPSPTGFLHVGGIRTALFAWLVAKQAKGQFILRFEDTDQAREVAGAREHLMKSLRALGLGYDEGPDSGGPFAPYVQSERLVHYRQWAQKLVDAGRAYADPYTAAEVQKFREDAQSAKKAFLYRDHRPADPPKWDGSQPLRFKSEPKAYKWHDEVMGDLSTGPEVIDDFILIKSDGFPTYNFAHIVDDAEMEISHVLRGQEFLASVPNYLNLYEALGIDSPILATLPHVVNTDGRKKLSKRDGAKDVLEYLAEGYLEEALISFIATLGWNDGTEQEVFTKIELVEKFSLARVQKSGAHFDERRLQWVNGTFIRKMPLDELYDRSKPFWGAEAGQDDRLKKQVLGLLQERLKYLSEIPELTYFFFEDLPVNNSLITTHKQLKKIDSKELAKLLSATRTSLEDSDFTSGDLTERLNSLLEQTGQKPAVLFSLVRIATTQSPASPGLADTLTILGKETTLRRIDQQLTTLNK